MFDISGKSWYKYLLFGSLYFTEGLQSSLALVIIPIYLLDKGFSLPLATFVAGIGGAPWFLKFIFGPSTDYFYKFGKKSFIIVGGLLGSFSLFVLVFINPIVFLIPFAIFLFLSHIGIAYVDVSCDGWAIQISKEKERGKINGAMMAGNYAGMTFGTAVLAPIAQFYGYSMSFLAGGIIILGLMIYPFLVKDIKILNKRPKIASILKKEFKKKSTQIISLFLFVSSIGFGLLVLVIPLFMKTILHMDIGQIGLVTTIYPISMVIGSLIGGTMADKWSRKIVLFIFCSALIISAALIFANTWEILAVIYGIIGFLNGGYLTASSALMMDICSPEICTTQYSILASICNFGEFGTEMVSGSLIAILGFSHVFLYSAWFCGPSLLLLYFIRLKKSDIH